MLKILHTADVHLGAKLMFLGEKAREQRKQIEGTFVKVVDTAVTQKVDLVLVAGDLFDSQFPAKSSVQLVSSQLERLTTAGVYVALIAGNHDLLEDGAIFSTDAFALLEKGGKLKIFRSGFETWEIKELDTTVYGGSVLSKKSKISPLARWKKSPTGTYHVGVAHGSLAINDDTDNHPITQAEIKALALDYLALGDWHSAMGVTKSPAAWYAGSPELVNSAQTGSGKCLLIEIESGKAEVEQVQVGLRVAKSLQLDIAKFPELKQLRQAIEAEADPNTCLRVELGGMRSLTQDFDLETLEQDLADRFFYLKLKDNSQLQLSPETLANFPEELIIGKYIRLLEAQKNGDAMHDSTIDEAIQYGVSLLQGKYNES